MYTDIPGQIKNTMKDKLKKKIGGGGGTKGTQTSPQIDKNYHL